MNYPPSHRWLFAFVMQLMLSACSAQMVSGEEPDARSEAEFWRTRYCVAGGLPMEVQFSLPGNPVKLEGESFDLSDVDRIIEQVDIKVKTLLKDSGVAAWEQTQESQTVQWSSEHISELADRLVIEITERAPRSLGIEFCGEHRSVGNDAYAAIIEYFLRAVRLEGGGKPAWLADAREQSNGGIIVMLAVALRLAEIEFDTGMLVQSLANQQN